MRRRPLGTVRLLALLLPANLLWMFFGCTAQCLAAADPGCLEHERGVACCAAGLEAPCGATDVSGTHGGCTIVVERGVLGAGGQRHRATVLDAAPTVLGFVTEEGRESRYPSPLGHSPPRPRPLDRLPTLLI